MLWENLREEEFAAAIEGAGKLCVVPIGCMEKHGQHLPVGTDTQTCYYIAKEAAKLEPVVVFPGLYFGDLCGLYMWKGTISFSSELLQQMLTELCAEIARNGFKKILLLNGHGGNTALLANFLRSTAHEKKDYVVMLRNDYQYGYKNILEDIDAGEQFPELTEGDVAYLRDFAAHHYCYGHGGINETAVMNVINPDCVDMSRINVDDGTSHGRTRYLNAQKGIGISGSGMFWMTDYPDSFSGEHLEGANARIGSVILKKRIALQAEACRLLKMDDRVLEWNDEHNAKF